MRISKIFLIFAITLVINNLNLISEQLKLENKRHTFSFKIYNPTSKTSLEFNNKFRENIIPIDLAERITALKNIKSNRERDQLLVSTGFPNYYSTLPANEEGKIIECFDKGKYLGAIVTDATASARVYYSEKCGLGKAFWRSSDKSDSCHIVAEYKSMWNYNNLILLWEIGTAGVLVTKDYSIIGEACYLDGEWFFVNSASRDITYPDYRFISDKDFLNIKKIFEDNLREITNAFLNINKEYKKYLNKNKNKK